MSWPRAGPWRRSCASRPPPDDSTKSKAQEACEDSQGTAYGPGFVVTIGQKRVLMFWTPTCGPCKPLLADLVALAAAKPPGLSVVGVVRSAVPDLEPPGEWRLERVERLVAEYQLGFPTCVHSSNRVTEAWRAEGVPITFLLSDKGVERAATGGRNGRALVAELSADAKVGSR